MTLDDCEAIFTAALQTTSAIKFREAIESLWAAYKVVILSVSLESSGKTFYRARRIDEELEYYPSRADLSYPPPEKTKAFRFNDDQSPCLYIAARTETTLAEIHASEGDRIQAIGYQIKPNVSIRMACIGQFAQVFKSGYLSFSGTDPGGAISNLLNSMPKSKRLLILYIDHFLAEVLADEKANTFNYVRSRELARLIYKELNVDGFIYPSVKDIGGFNLAIKPDVADRALRDTLCSVIRVDRCRHYHLYEETTLKEASGVDDEGNFIWK